jgi:DNA-binding PadR family transcriptional regulator
VRVTQRDPKALLPLPALPYYVLLALSEGVAHGWVLIKRIREITDGQSNPSSGSLYLAMIRMERQGLIEEAAAPAGEEADTRRRHYRLTPFGRAAVRAESARLAQLVTHARKRNVLPHPSEGR